MSPAPRRSRDPILLSFAVLLLLAGKVAPEDVNQDTAPAAIAPAVLSEEKPAVLSEDKAPVAVVAAPAAAEPAELVPSRGDRSSASHPPARAALAEARSPEASSGSTPQPVPDLATRVLGSAPRAKIAVIPAVPLLQDEFAQGAPSAFGEASLSPAMLSVVVAGVHAGDVTLHSTNSITDRAFGIATGVASITQNQAINGVTVQNISILATTR
jgi:hypothetical protein